MVSRDTRVHLVAIGVYVGLLALWSVLGQVIGPFGNLFELFVPLVSFVMFFVLFAGAHLYLALRGEDGIVPVDARWRYVLAFPAFLALVYAGTVLRDGPSILGVEVSLVLYASAAVLVVGYVGYESWDGYRERAPG